MDTQTSAPLVKITTGTLLYHATVEAFDGTDLRGVQYGGEAGDPVWFSFDPGHAARHIEIRGLGQEIRVLEYRLKADAHLVDACSDPEILSGYDNDTYHVDVAIGVLERGVAGWTDGHEVMLGDVAFVEHVRDGLNP